MFWPSLKQAIARAFIGFGLLTVPAGAAFAQSVGDGSSAEASIHVVKVFHAPPTDNGQAMAMLAALSSEAGIPFFPKPEAHKNAVALHQGENPDPALCIRAGVSLNPAVMSGPQMTVEHGLVGCPTNTAGIPLVVVQDPALQAPPSSRTGQYNLDVTVRYRLIEMKRVQVIASVTEQGVAYTLDSPVSGNNLLAALTVMF
jgi:hypothetical protein